MFYFVYTISGTTIISLQEGHASLYTLAEGGLGDWFGGVLYSAGQQANVAVQDQLSALSFTRFKSHIVLYPFFPPFRRLRFDTKYFLYTLVVLAYLCLQFGSYIWCWSGN